MAMRFAASRPTTLSLMRSTNSARRRMPSLPKVSTSRLTPIRIYEAVRNAEGILLAGFTNQSSSKFSHEDATDQHERATIAAGALNHAAGVLGQLIEEMREQGSWG